jgi:uncharacterized hydrophobic protein (TIGR00271 family)
MLHRDANESLSYWLQLVVSVGIATLGLVVGSAAVVIGAMLVAPLLGPIVGLAMGLATGSPFLVLRSAGRILLSVLVAVSGAALITWLLPFHELNAELSGRATPTVLDLITAAFCAVAGVYASLRSGSDTAATAAGTSIGISLVPPLCACGYGLGTLSWSMAGGAALLFLTNLVAIVAVGGIGFAAAGFNRVNVVDLERQELSVGRDAPVARVLAKRLAALFESGLGPLFRLLMPFVLLAVVYVPLRRALDEVAWEVRARKVVRSELAAQSQHIVDSKVQVAGHAIEMVVVLLGTAQDAEQTRIGLAERLERATGVTPSLEVLGVPDAKAFAGLQSTLLTPHPQPTAKASAPGAEVRDSLRLAEAALLRFWPMSSLGKPVSIAVQVDGDSLGFRVAHLGETLAPAATEALELALTRDLKAPVTVIAEAIPAEVAQRGDDDFAFLAKVGQLMILAQHFPTLSACITQPGVKTQPRALPRETQFAEAFQRLVANVPAAGRRTAATFSVKLQNEECPSPPAPPESRQSGTTPPAEKR